MALTKPFGTMVKFLQPGVGAVLRTVHDKLREFTSPQDFGAVGDGTADDSAALTKAINKAIAQGYGGICVPAGIYRLDSAVVAAMPAFSGFAIKGAGPDLTEFRVNGAAGNGFVLSSLPGNWWLDASPHNPLVLEGFTLSTTKENVGTGIALNMGSLEGRPAPGVVIRDINIRGHSGFSQLFAKACDFLDTSGLRCDNVKVVQGGPGNTNGIAFDIRASGASTDPVDIKFTNCTVTFGQYGWRVGDHIEGVYLTQCDCVAVTSAAYWHVVAESGIHVLGGHFNTHGPAFDLDGVFDGTITNTLIYSNSGLASWRGIASVNGGSLTFTGNVIRGAGVSGEIGIAVDHTPNEGTHGYMVAGNHICNTDVAVTVGGNARKVFVGDNQYLNVNTRVLNLAPSANNNCVYGKEHVESFVVAIAGGSPTVEVLVQLPPGRFIAKPTYVGINSMTELAVGAYDFDSVLSTATVARCVVRKLDGTNFAAGDHRFNVIVKE